jgi:hypothetical protein
MLAPDLQNKDLTDMLPMEDFTINELLPSLKAARDEQKRKKK